MHCGLQSQTLEDLKKGRLVSFHNLPFPDTKYNSKITVILVRNCQTFDVDHCFCFTAISFKTVFPSVLLLTADNDQFMDCPIFIDSEIVIWEYLLEWEKADRNKQTEQQLF